MKYTEAADALPDDTVLSPAHLCWLKNGGPFPEKLRVRSSHGERTYNVCNRDAQGRVFDIHNNARIGKKGFVLFVEDPETEEALAAKLCLTTDFVGPKTIGREHRLAAALRPSEGLFADIFHAGTVDAFEGQPNDDIQWACFILQRVTGRTIKDIIQTSIEDVTPALVCDISTELIRAKLFLISKGLKHDDLHWGNIMLRKLDPALSPGRSNLAPLRLTIIDTGSLKLLSDITSKPHDDWARVTKVLAQLHNALHHQRQYPSRYPRFMEMLATFCANLLETDRLRVFPTEDSYYDAIEKMRYHTMVMEDVSEPVFSPFDGISAEHLASDTLLLGLFVKALPWMDLVQAQRPVVLTGPRGCGKSMVFRYMSAKTHLATPDSGAKYIAQFPFVGIYVSCSSDLQSDVLWLHKHPDTARELAPELQTLFALLLAREMFRLFDRLLYMPKVGASLGISAHGVMQLIAFCREYLPSNGESTRLSISTVAGDFAEELDRLKRQVSRRLYQNFDSVRLAASFIGDLCKEVCRVFPEFKKRPLLFLLDDYTSHRIPVSVQRILNEIVFTRHGEHMFKVSSEKFGIALETDSGLRIDADREYEPVDAGARVLDIASESERREFVTRLIDRRLQQANYAGSVNTLIGQSEQREDTDLARRIRSTNHSKGRAFYYNGIEVLANMWSGDVATILHVARSMFSRGRVNSASSDRISNEAQHDAIRHVSQGIVRQVQSYSPLGGELHSILVGFGRLSAELLTKGKEDISDSQRGRVVRQSISTPQRKYRIEHTVKAGEDFFDNLAAADIKAANIARELLRRAVFIELQPSRGKEGKNTETVRWQLRSAFLPSFGVSLIRHHYIDIKTTQQFVDLLLNTENFVATMSQRYGSNERGADLFDGMESQ